MRPGGNGMKLRNLLLASVGCAAAAIAIASPALARADEGTTLEEVVVTARKKTEKLQEAPVSATVLTAQALERQGVKTMQDVALRTPGLGYGNFGDLKLSPTSLRGIVSSAGSAGADPAVGYYVDEVFVGQGAGANLDLYDIERVEVLRGPQGTFFGRNTVGGVINITTTAPSRDFRGSITATGGNFNFQRVAASVSGPIVADHVFGKISIVEESRDGTSDNAWLKRDVNTKKSWSARAGLLFDMGENTSLQLNADFRHVDQEPLAFETLKYNPNATLTQVLGLFGLPLNTRPYDYKVFIDDKTEERLNGGGASATFKTQIGDVRITNVASYHKHDYFSRDDTDRSPFSMLYDGDPETVWRWSEELRAEGSAGAFDWLAGVYYFRQNTKNLSFVELGSGLAALFGDPSLAHLQTGSTASLDTTSKAVFGSVTWKATDRFDLTFGGRYTRDEKTIDYSQFDPLALLGGTFTLKASDSWGEFTPTFNARYRFTPEIMGYATIAKGFKSGGYNDALGDANGISFGPETLWNYEAGLKSELFDRRLIANVSVYYMKWSDIQISVDDPSTIIYDPIISNAGAAHSKGVEFELIARPIPPLTLQAGLSIQDARYEEGTVPAKPPAPPKKLDKIPYAPNYSYNFSAEYRLPLGPGDLTLFGQYLGRGTSYLTPDNQADGKVKPYGMVDARISWAPSKGDWRVSLWGKNLTDNVHKERLFDLYGQDLVGQKFIILNDPKTYGVEVSVKF